MTKLINIVVKNLLKLGVCCLSEAQETHVIASIHVNQHLTTNIHKM